MKKLILAISIMILGTSIHAQDKEIHVELNTTDVITYKTNALETSYINTVQVHFYEDELIISGASYSLKDIVLRKTNDGECICFEALGGSYYFIFYDSNKNVTSIRIVSKKQNLIILYYSPSNSIKVPQYFLDLPSYLED